MRVFFLIILLMSTSAHADVLLMKNGDRITGDITQIWDGKVTIEPAYSDDFNVDLSDVVSIETEEEFDLELYDKEEGVYKFTGIDRTGNALLLSETDELVVPYSEIKRVEEIQGGIDWKSRGDFSSSISSGNTNSASNSLNGSLQFNIDNQRALLELSSVRSKVEEETVRNSDRWNLSYNYLFKEFWFLAVNGNYEQDEIALVNNRYALNPALGYDIWDDPFRTFNIQLGAGYQSEIVAGEKNTGVVVDWRLRFSYDFLGGDLEFYHNHQLVQIQDDNEVRNNNLVLNSTTGIRYDIVDDIYLNLEFKYDFESEPASEEIKGENLLFLVGVGIELD